MKAPTVIFYTPFCQSTVDTVKVADGDVTSSVQVAMNMPFEIRSVTSPTHEIRMKVCIWFTFCKTPAYM